MNKRVRFAGGCEGKGGKEGKVAQEKGLITLRHQRKKTKFQGEGGKKRIAFRVQSIGNRGGASFTAGSGKRFRYKGGKKRLWPQNEKKSRIVSCKALERGLELRMFV